MVTKGWDTISIIKQDAINTQLTNMWEGQDAHFFRMVPDGFGNVEGIFDCFQVINGGGGRIVRMKLPIKSGKLTLDEMQVNLDGLEAIIEITLSLMPLHDNLSVLKTEYKNLAASREEMTADKTGWILPITMIDVEGKTGAFANVVLDCICKYLIENPAQLELAFAEINFAKSTSPEWALPKKCAYSYLDSGYLAIMAVCDNKDISGLPLDIDVSGITLGTNSFYVMSSELMLRNLILPGLIDLYQNANQNSYSYKDGELLNIHELQMHSIKSGALHYTPVVYQRGNVLSVNGDHITVSYTGKCDMRAGINMYWNGFVKLKIALGSNGTISFYKADSSFSDDEDIPPELAWLLVIVGLIVQFVVSLISDDLISSIEKRSGSIMATNIDTVKWCKQTAIAKSAYIAESLILEYK